MVVFHSDRRSDSFAIRFFWTVRFKKVPILFSASLAPGRNCVMTWSLTAHRGLLHPLKLYLAHIAVYMCLRCLTFNFFACFFAKLFLMNVDTAVIQSVLLFVTFLLIVNENENELYWPGMFTHTRNRMTATGQDTDNKRIIYKIYK